MDCWKILGIEPTADIGAIRSAYAAQTKNFHPEDDPNGFLHLRTAYEQAIRFARAEVHAVLTERKASPAFDFDLLLAKGMTEYHEELRRCSTDVIEELRRLPKGPFYAGLGRWKASLSREPFLRVQYLPAFMEALAQLLEGPPRYPECIRKTILRRYRFRENKAGPADRLYRALTADSDCREIILGCFLYVLYLTLIGWCAKRHAGWAFFLVFFVPTAAVIVSKCREHLYRSDDAAGRVIRKLERFWK